MTPSLEWPAHPQPVRPEAIRRAFNEGRYYERMLSGEIEARLRNDSHPERPVGDEPVCTRSQMYSYWLNGAPVALVHQYTRPDGSIGASGRPDPKVLVLDDGSTLRPVSAIGL